MTDDLRPMVGVSIAVRKEDQVGTAASHVGFRPHLDKKLDPVDTGWVLKVPTGTFFSCFFFMFFPCFFFHFFSMFFLNFFSMFFSSLFFSCFFKKKLFFSPSNHSVYHSQYKLKN